METLAVWLTIAMPFAASAEVQVQAHYNLNGQACTGMRYREAVDSIDIVLQTVICRQHIYDGTWHKTASMGWVNVNTGLTGTAKIRDPEGKPKTFKLDREFNVRVPVEITANGFSWLVIE